MRTCPRPLRRRSKPTSGLARSRVIARVDLVREALAAERTCPYEMYYSISNGSGRLPVTRGGAQACDVFCEARRAAEVVALKLVVVDPRQELGHLGGFYPFRGGFEAGGTGESDDPPDDSASPGKGERPP